MFQDSDQTPASTEEISTIYLPRTPVVLHKVTNLFSSFPQSPSFSLPSHTSMKLSYPITNGDYVLANISITSEDTSFHPKKRSNSDLQSPRTTIVQSRTSCMISKSLNPRIQCLEKSGSTSVFHAFMKSGYRTSLFFNPTQTNAAIVTCGGLCPGLNSAIHGLVKTLFSAYKVNSVKGVIGGYSGFKHPFINLNLETISEISNKGGSILKTNRGGFDAELIYNRLTEENIQILFIIGGDGTHRAATKLINFINSKKQKISIVCLPKSIDNDIGLIDHTFGFSTAIDEARKAIESVIVEAMGQPNCVGLVKIMGREAGFIASAASVSNGDVDICLIPEIKFNLEEFGDKVKGLINSKGRCVIVMSEGCYKSLENVEKYIDKENRKYDKGGNLVLPKIETFILDMIHAKLKDMDYTIKFNNPKYMIRTVGANSADAIFINQLAQNAVHGAMAGFTGFSSVSINRRMVMIPLGLIDKHSPAQLNPKGKEIESLYNSLS